MSDNKSQASKQAALCFVDSNVWLYIFLPGQDKNKAAIAKRLIQQKKSNIVVSTQVINEIMRNLFRNKAISEVQARHLIRAFYQEYQVVPVNEPVQIQASMLREKYSFSYWDSLITAAALESKAVTLYSEDMQDGLTLEKQLTIVNPF